MNRTSIYLFVCLILFNTCSTPRPEGRTEGEVLFREANALIEDERYLLANEKLNQLRSQHPYSYYATHAELLQADILFKQENYVEAASAYIVFRDFHPKFKELNYVIWKIAESFYFQMPSTHDRDLTAGHEAIKFYKELIQLFPDSKYIDEAKNKMNYCREMIENKQLYIADFYFRTEEYSAAIYRYLDVISNLKHEKILDKAMIRILESSLKLQDKQKCNSYFTNFSTQISSSRKKDFFKIHEKCERLEDKKTEEG